MMEDDTLRVAVIGNGPQVYFLSELLRLQNHKVVVYSSATYNPEIQPYYPNDINAGIMKKFLADSDIEVGYSKRFQGFHFEYGDIVYDIPSNFQSFENYLYENYPNEKRSLINFMQAVKAVGEEWSQYIKSGFTSAECLKLSGRLFALSLEDAFIKYDLRSPSLLRLMRLLIPEPNVMFNVFCGYIYTQMFDVWAIDKDVLCNCLRRPTRIVVSSLNEILVNEKTTEGDYDAVVDFRNCDKNKSPNNETVVLGYFIQYDSILCPDIEYIIQIPSDNCTIRIWNERLVQLNGSESKWLYELIYMKHIPTDLHQSGKRLLEDYVVKKIDKYEMWFPDVIDKYYDTNHANGYEWAFDKERALKDPTNLVYKNSNSLLKSRNWGFAWFSAAYHAANIVNSQMKCGEKQYVISIIPAI